MCVRVDFLSFQISWGNYKWELRRHRNFIRNWKYGLTRQCESRLQCCASNRRVSHTFREEDSCVESMSSISSEAWSLWKTLFNNYNEKERTYNEVTNCGRGCKYTSSNSSSLTWHTKRMMPKPFAVRCIHVIVLRIRCKLKLIFVFLA